MKISLLIPAYNEEKYIGACLQSIQMYGKDVYEVIVINNASTDKTAEIAHGFAHVRVVDEPQPGLPYARARGLAEATGDYIAYIDADCRVYKDWFAKIEKKFKTEKNIVSLSGPYRYYDMTFFQNILAQVGWWTSAPLASWIVGYALLGGNCVVRADVMREIGGFSRDIMFYGDDMDLARRLAPHGTVLFPMDFFIYTSGRRLKSTGIVKTFWIYGLNFLWEVLYKKPYSSSHENIR